MSHKPIPPKELGKVAYMDGKSYLANPYPVTSQEHSDWHVGYLYETYSELPTTWKKFFDHVESATSCA